jgi:hypothetical protein
MDRISVSNSTVLHYGQTDNGTNSTLIIYGFKVARDTPEPTERFKIGMF